MHDLTYDPDTDENDTHEQRAIKDAAKAENRRVYDIGDTAGHQEALRLVRQALRDAGCTESEAMRPLEAIRKMGQRLADALRRNGELRGRLDEVGGE